MAEIIDRSEIYRRLDICRSLFEGCEGDDEAAQAVLDLIRRDQELIQAAMILMLQKDQPRSET